MQQRRALGQRRLDARRHGQRLVVHEHALGAVLGDVAVARDDDADRLADVARDVDGGRVVDDPRAERRREGTRVRGDVGARHDADHAGQRERGRGVDRADARVRERRAHDRRAARVRQRIEIVDEPALAAQQGVVLDAQQPSGRRDRAPVHADGSGSPRSGMINRCRPPERAILAPWRQPREPRSPPSTGRCACSRSWRAAGRSAPPSSQTAPAAPRPPPSASRARCRRAASSSRTRTRPTASARAACCWRPACTRASTSAARRCPPWRRCATRRARPCS